MFRQQKPLAADFIGFGRFKPGYHMSGKNLTLVQETASKDSWHDHRTIRHVTSDSRYVSQFNGQVSMFEFRRDDEEDLTQVMQAICRINKHVPSPSYPYLVRVVPPPTWIFGRKPGEVALARAFGLDNNDNYAAASAEFAKGVIMTKAGNVGKSLSTNQIIEQIGAVNARLGGSEQPTEYQRTVIEAFFNRPKKPLH
jgi:hypothetical protein